ncbi:hypothetical protein GDO78_000086 [Eleutherodactylus coqui]|uniref:Uncharacterized protein n=1 Tax=Eleutherodactylus coqui TaxID=57060 RepID=A0A8J6FPL5_ELECQ|nr:hypothetical protein GDO78_000086 [Eleutherodactylus coqui]
MLPDLLTAIPASHHKPLLQSHRFCRHTAKCLTIVYVYITPHSPPRHTVHISTSPYLHISRPFTFCITPLLVVCKLVRAGPSPLLFPSTDYYVTVVL